MARCYASITLLQSGAHFLHAQTYYTIYIIYYSQKLSLNRSFSQLPYKKN